MDRSSSFRGNFLHSLDDKGRVSLPAVFRQRLEESTSVVLTNFVCDGARCLDGFTLPHWEKFEEKLRQRSQFDPKVRKLENYYLARAAECSVDGNGRIHIPQHLRSYASLEREVIFASTLQGFRIWERRVWDLVFREAEQALLDNPGLFVDVD